MHLSSFAWTLLFACALPTATRAQSLFTPQYEVHFAATWSSATHPGAYPSGAHFSPLIGTNHDASFHLWQSGGLATPGIESMAETGATAPLTNEITSAISLGVAGEMITGAGLSSPGATSTLINVSSAHSRISVVTMVAPSPDWFLGIDSVELFENGQWLDSKVIDLYAFDAGTDSGPTFTSPNQNTSPQDPIALITNGPFFGTTPLGRFTITRTAIETYCAPKQNSQGCFPAIFSNGSPSASSTNAFDIRAANVINNSSGLLFYGFGEAALPFQGGTLCVQAPLVRTPVQNSGGTQGGTDCTGTYSFDFNAWLQSGNDPLLGVGARVHAQYWYRDVQSLSRTGLTDALTFVIAP